jgi:hypothetical protein
MRPQHRVWRMHEVCLCVDWFRGHAPAHCVCLLPRTEPNGWLRGAAPFGVALREELPSAPRRPQPTVGEVDGVRCECVAEFMGRVVGREWLHQASAWHQRMRHHCAACNFRFHATCCALRRPVCGATRVAQTCAHGHTHSRPPCCCVRCPGLALPYGTEEP